MGGVTIVRFDPFGLGSGKAQIHLNGPRASEPVQPSRSASSLVGVDQVHLWSYEPVDSRFPAVTVLVRGISESSRCRRPSCPCSGPARRPDGGAFGATLDFRAAELAAILLNFEHVSLLLQNPAPAIIRLRTPQTASVVRSQLDVPRVRAIRAHADIGAVAQGQGFSQRRARCSGAGRRPRCIEWSSVIPSNVRVSGIGYGCAKGLRFRPGRTAG